MYKKLSRNDRYFLLGVITFIGVLSAGIVMAGSILPTPGQKPEITSVKIITVTDSSAKSIPLPPRKPKKEFSFFKGGLFSSETPTKAEAKTKTVSVQDAVINDDKFFPDKQARLYKEIFDLQHKGKMSDADAKIDQLNNSILMGHVLANRYLHPTAYKASYTELAGWMKKYADHPQAAQIHKLALTRKPRKSGALVSPVKAKKISGNLGAVSKRGKTYRTTKTRTIPQEAKVAAFKKDIKNQLRKNQPTVALNILNSDYTMKFIDSVEYDRLLSDIAAGYLFVNKLDQASSLANKAYRRSGAKAPLSGWVKGLVHWQRGQYQSAAYGFEKAAGSSYSSGWMVSASAYWASRANMRAGNVQKVTKWLDVASTYPRTFYGLIATRALGHKTEFDWSVPEISRAYKKNIEDTTHGRRATALIKVNETSLAEAELRNINFRKDAETKKSLMAYASYYKLPALSMQLGNAIKNEKGLLYDAALYPDTSWAPKTGYKIDRALLHAIMRQESRFKTDAQNPSGATGLMQLMPATANYITGKEIYHLASGQHQLKAPSVNLELGQTYIKTLLEHPAVGNDLLSLAIAYNAGPGNLSKWKRERRNVQDPLLFIETIPFHETRAFVERVMSNYWIYRMRYDQDTPSLDAVAQGKWAQYAAQDIHLQQIAAAY